MVKTVCRYLFPSLRNRDGNIGNYLKKGSIFGYRERKYANTWGGGGCAHGQESLQDHFYGFLFAFILICFHCAFTFMRF